MITVLTVSILTWICILGDPRPVVRVPDPTFQSIAIAFGVLAFQVGCSAYALVIHKIINFCLFHS